MGGDSATEEPALIARGGGRQLTATTQDAPATYAADGDASSATTAAIARASPGRPTGTPAAPR
ncbi:hypothetical protein [Micromonospora sp. DT47]|uniref:hypothetical protein n=1 Tax=Micromonospora sp. DT47 TaxID=3393431 RepID=UPI003CF55699